MDLPDDLANGFVGTLLLNVPHNTTPFRVGILAAVGGGRLIRILISSEASSRFTRQDSPSRRRCFASSGAGRHRGRDCAAYRA
jgi:hypothetical protein